MVTDAMLKSGSEALWCRLDLNGHTLDGVKRAAADCYAAMHAARPTTDLGEDGERLWAALTKFQSPDGTWLQIGKIDFTATVYTVLGKSA